uniref:hypothetical protein n=1 Tax=Limnohabitans sp. TaxID=1907725 RepID=UPI004047C0F1
MDKHALDQHQGLCPTCGMVRMRLGFILGMLLMVNKQNADVMTRDGFITQHQAIMACI